MSSQAPEIREEILRNQDLVAALTKYGLKRFLTKNQFDLCHGTKRAFEILGLFGADDGTIAVMEAKVEPFKKNHEMYNYVQTVGDPGTLIGALVTTNNTTALQIIRDVLTSEGKIPIINKTQTTQGQGQESVDSTDSAGTTTTTIQQEPSSSGVSGTGAQDFGCFGKLWGKKAETYKCKNIRVLLINQKFDNPYKLFRDTLYAKNRRSGSEVDTPALQDLFQNVLKMTFEVQENVESTKISEILKEFQENCIKDGNDGCIVFFSTHGFYPDSLVMDDLVPINLHKDVVQKFGRDEFKDFVGKPKIFFFNACRNMPQPVPDSTDLGYSDILIVYSTPPLHPSFRWEMGTPDPGSCFIQALYKICPKTLDKKYTIQRLIHEVGNKLAEDKALQSVIQIPETSDLQFEKTFYLQPNKK